MSKRYKFSINLWIFTETIYAFWRELQSLSTVHTKGSYYSYFVPFKRCTVDVSDFVLKIEYPITCGRHHESPARKHLSFNGSLVVHHMDYVTEINIWHFRRICVLIRLKKKTGILKLVCNGDGRNPYHEHCVVSRKKKKNNSWIL